MPLLKLDHVNVRTRQLNVMMEWYVEVLGLRSGERPHFPFAGAWLYVGDVPHVHLVDVEQDPGAGSEGPLKLEHFAFSATGLEEFLAHLESRGERYRRSDLAAAKLVQINVWDPDGNHIHIDFPA